MSGGPRGGSACPRHARERPGCALACEERGQAGVPLPGDERERTVCLVLRFIAAGADTGDAACWDAAFDLAEAEFGPRDGALVVARAGALLRALHRDGIAVRFLPPPCRWLSAGEAVLVAALRARRGGARGPVGLDASPRLRAALGDLVVPALLPPSGAAMPDPGPHAIGHGAPFEPAARHSSEMF